MIQLFKRRFRTHLESRIGVPAIEGSEVAPRHIFDGDFGDYLKMAKYAFDSLIIGVFRVHVCFIVINNEIVIDIVVIIIIVIVFGIVIGIVESLF